MWLIVETGTRCIFGYGASTAFDKDVAFDLPESDHVVCTGSENVRITWV